MASQERTPEPRAQSTYSRTESHGSAANAFRSFNEILGEIGHFQLWTAFLIILSGISVSWENVSFVFLTDHSTPMCIDPAGLKSGCNANCKEYFINATFQAQSIAYEWKFFCQDTYKNDLAMSVLTIGQIFGCLFYGHLADQIGRRPTFLSACMMKLVMGVMIGLSSWFWFFCLMRFFVGIACGGMSIICLAFLVEYVDFSRREFMIIMYCLPYTLGIATLPILSYFIWDWRGIQLSTSAFAIFYISYFWLIPESPRWLFITGQLERCIAVLHAGAIRNKRPTDRIRTTIETVYDEMRAENFSRSSTMVDLFKTRNLCKKSCIILFAWFTSCLINFGVYDHMAREGTMSINLKFFVAGWLTALSTLLAYPILKWAPRKYSLSAIFVLSAFFKLMLLIEIDFQTHAVLVTVFSCIQLVLMAMATCILYLFSAEIFPTLLRNSGIGLCLSFGLASRLAGPFLHDINPNIACGCFALATAILLLLLPETKGEILPDTIEEGEEFGKNFGLNCRRNC